MLVADSLGIWPVGWSFASPIVSNDEPPKMQRHAASHAATSAPPPIAAAPPAAQGCIASALSAEMALARSGHVPGLPDAHSATWFQVPRTHRPDG